MAHGAPDWWGTEPTATVHQVQDAGELAVRLGSPVSHDRRGNVVFMDSFEHGFNKWLPATDGTDGSAVLSALLARTGAYSAKITGDSDPTKYMSLYRIMPIPVEGKVGVEVSFTVSGDMDRIEARAVIDNRTDLMRAGVRYNQTDGDFEYYNSAGGWTDIDADVAPYAFGGAFHTMKFVFDTSINEYVRAILNHEEHDILGNAIEVAATGAVENMAIWIEVYSDTGENPVIHVEDIIVTQNEP